MGLTLTRVLADPFHYVIPGSNCAFHFLGLCCMSDDRYVSTRWEGRRPSVALPSDQSHVRVFLSDDQGATWDLIATFDTGLTLTWLHPFSPGGDRLLVGIDDACTAAFSAHSIIAVSEDAGLTWAASGVSAVTYTAMAWGAGTIGAETRGFVQLSALVVLAYGRYDFNEEELVHFLKSTDGGQTFARFATIPGEFSIEGCIALSATDLVATTGIRPYVSTDGGLTWTEGTMPSFSDLAMRALAWMGGDIVLDHGRNSSLAQGAIYRSEDRGATWATLAALPGTSNTSGFGVTLRALTTQIAVAGGSGATADAFPTYWLTEDQAVTWAAVTMVGTTAKSRHNDLTVTSQGWVLAGLDAPAAILSSVLAENQCGEIWRGRPDEFEGPGTCEAAPFEPEPEPEPEPEEPEEPLAALQQQGRFRQSLRVTGTYRP